MVEQQLSGEERAVGVAADGSRRRTADATAPARAGRYRTYARVAAAAFFLVALYTLAVKLPGGEFERDWLHTALHIASGSLAAYAGWIATRAAAARTFTLGLTAVYGALGLGGWFVDGIFTGSTFRIPLAAADNVFHLLLAAGAVATAAAPRLRPSERPRVQNHLR